MKKLGRVTRLPASPMPRLVILRDILWASLLSCLALVIAPGSASAQSISRAMLERKVLLTSEREAALQPLVVESTTDGGVIVAGGISATRQGWATKLDAGGTVRWSYYRDLLEKPDYPLGIHPEYDGAVPMPDGSVYLCGTMPRLRQGDFLALITHLDSAGRVLGEQLLAPQGGKSVQVHGCVSWQGGIVLKGSVYGPQPFQSIHWLLAMDAAGKPKWEKLIPPSTGAPDPGSAFEGTVLLPFDDKLIFSATDNRKTELVNLAPDGQVVAQKVLEGRFLFSRPVVPDRLLTAFGWFTSFDSPRVALTFDPNFNEIHKAQGGTSRFAPRLIYRLPDGSLVLFGATAYAPGGPSYRAGVVHMDRGLHKEETLHVDEDGFVDGGHIFAAAPTQLVGEFALATNLHAAPGGPNSPLVPDSGFKRGGVLKLVLLTPNR